MLKNMVTLIVCEAHMHAGTDRLVKGAGVKMKLRFLCVGRLHAVCASHNCEHDVTRLSYQAKF